MLIVKSTKNRSSRVQWLKSLASHLAARQRILQLVGFDHPLIDEFRRAVVDVNFLFDFSGGREKLATEWTRVKGAGQ